MRFERLHSAAPDAFGLFQPPPRLLLMIDQ
jgi:hypothetical protein